MVQIDIIEIVFFVVFYKVLLFLFLFFFLNSCNIHPCLEYKWIPFEWGACDKACGNGVRTREVRCYDNADVLVPDNQCPTNKPSSSQSLVQIHFFFSSLFMPFL